MTTITGTAYVFSFNGELHAIRPEEIISSGLSYEEFKHTKTLDYFISKGLLSAEDALKFNVNTPSLSAFINGSPVEDALKFEHWSQFSAYSAGASIEDSLTFIVNNTDLHGLSYAINAIKLGASIDQAFGFVDNYISSEALRIGKATIAQALNIKTHTQLDALKAGADPEQAVNFTLDEQVYALEHGIPIELALRVTDEDQVWYLLEQKDMSIEEALAAGLKISQLPAEPGSECLDLLLSGENATQAQECYDQYL